MASEDMEWVERIRQGDPDDFGEIVRRYQSRVFGILYRYERDHHRLEDLAQETFVKAWRALQQFDGRAPFEHWLSRIAVHVALDHLRKQKRTRPEMALAELSEDALDLLADPREHGEETNRQARELLDLALSQLSPADRLVITLQEIEGRSIREISATTGWSGVAVRVRAMRARIKLRKILHQMEQEAYERKQANPAI
jgi:RNA polymerase sigma-70 factor (ECF subfamily)